MTATRNRVDSFISRNYAATREDRRQNAKCFDAQVIKRREIKRTNKEKTSVGRIKRKGGGED